jgi:hypothetical protein
MRVLRAKGQPLQCAQQLNSTSVHAGLFFFLLAVSAAGTDWLATFFLVYRPFGNEERVEGSAWNLAWSASAELPSAGHRAALSKIRFALTRDVCKVTARTVLHAGRSSI